MDCIGTYVVSFLESVTGSQKKLRIVPPRVKMNQSLASRRALRCARACRLVDLLSLLMTSNIDVSVHEEQLSSKPFVSDSLPLESQKVYRKSGEVSLISHWFSKIATIVIVVLVSFPDSCMSFAYNQIIRCVRWWWCEAARLEPNAWFLWSIWRIDTVNNHEVTSTVVVCTGGVISIPTIITSKS